MVCDFLEREGLRINVSLIGRELVRQGVKVLEQSIRNNKRVMEYIRIRAEEQVVEVREFTGTGELAEQIRALQAENMALRQLLRSVKLVN